MPKEEKEPYRVEIFEERQKSLQTRLNEHAKEGYKLFWMARIDHGPVTFRLVLVLKDW